MDAVLKFDFFILDLIRNNLTCGFFDGLMVFFTKLGDGGIVWIALTVICLISDKYRKVGAAMAVSLVIALLAGVMGLKELVARPRPFQLKDVYLLIPEPAGFSFPSGHTMASFAAAFSVWLHSQKRGDTHFNSRSFNRFFKDLSLCAFLNRCSRGSGFGDFVRLDRHCFGL